MHVRRKKKSHGLILTGFWCILISICIGSTLLLSLSFFLAGIDGAKVKTFSSTKAFFLHSFKYLTSCGVLCLLVFGNECDAVLCPFYIALSSINIHVTQRVYGFEFDHLSHPCCEVSSEISELSSELAPGAGAIGTGCAGPAWSEI